MSLSRSLVFFSVSIVQAVVAAGIPSPAAAQCSRVSLSPSPEWLSDVIWAPPVGKILAVDAGLNRVLLYAPDGKGSMVPEPKGEYPSLATYAEGRVLLRVVGGNVESLDPANLGSRQLVPRLKSVPTEKGQLKSINQWVGVGDSILAFGHVRAPELPRGVQPGLFRVDAKGAGQLLKSVDSWDYYHVGYQYLTAIGPTGYFLDVADSQALLYEVAPGGALRPLSDALPLDLRSMPPIDAKMSGPADAPNLFKQLEHLTMVAGIYGNSADGKLYVLTRKPVPTGGTDWWLYRVDPKDGPQGKILGKTHLPTSANFLSVVVSPESTYLIERGSVDTLGNQAIKSMVAVPAALLQGTLQGSEICPRFSRE